MFSKRIFSRIFSVFIRVSFNFCSLIFPIVCTAYCFWVLMVFIQGHLYLVIFCVKLELIKPGRQHLCQLRIQCCNWLGVVPMHVLVPAQTRTSSVDLRQLLLQQRFLSSDAYSKKWWAYFDVDYIFNFLLVLFTYMLLEAGYHSVKQRFQNFWKNILLKEPNVACERRGGSSQQG